MPQPLASEPQTTIPAGEFAPRSREDYARGLFFIAWLGLAFPPVAFVTLYFLIHAAFGDGPLSPRGCYNLFVGGFLTFIALCFALVMVCGGCLGGFFGAFL